MNDRDRLAELLAGTGPLLLDFDGPVCSVFAGYPAPEVAAELLKLLRNNGIDLPEAVATEPDPLEVVRWTGRLGKPELTRTVDDALRAAELRAVPSAAPTPYAHDAIKAARQAGKPVAIISNNSAEAIAAYLTLHGLTAQVVTVIGRAYGQPELMKPNPEPVRRAVAALGTDPGACVLVGDSITDVEAALAAGVPCVGYANKPGKDSRLAAAGAHAVVTSMNDITTCLACLTR